MKLPGGERAVVDIAKLRDYCLNDQHSRGRHKARVFASALGLTVAHADFLRQELLRAAVECEASESDCDGYGQRCVIDLDVSGPQGRASVRSSWIVLSGEDFPRLTSCYVF